MSRLPAAAAILAALALAATACASSKDTGLPPGPSAEPTGGGTTVTMPGTELRFEPETLTVKVGDTVTWNNDGSLPHTVTAEADAPVQFDSGNLDPGATFQFTFQEAGEIPYYCRLHAAPGSRTGMVGTIVVQAA